MTALHTALSGVEVAFEKDALGEQDERRPREKEGQGWVGLLGRAWVG